jgi:hypothetical protein
MDQEIAKRKDTEAVSEAGLLSAVECARLYGVSRRVSSVEINEQIVEFLGYLYDGFKRGGSPWAQFEAELRAVYSERQPNASDCAVLHTGNRKKDLS